MVLVKVCGITNLDDALASADAGADALGFNSTGAVRVILRRRLHGPSSIVCGQIIQTLLNVGVFVNESLDAIKKYRCV